jgi:glutamyl-tRNA synthetase
MVVTRFAPSPTGYLHIGGLRTALYSYLWARKNNGKFFLRIEDTDQKRNSEDAMEAIKKAFEWSGLNYDGEVVYQSKRFDLYKRYIKQLLDEGKAYYCYMTKKELDELRESQIAKKQRPRYDGRYRDFKGIAPKGVDPVVRIKTPQSKVIEFEDGIKGKVSFNTDDMMDDFIIARADGSPTYNFVVAIDDALMGLTDVIRGDDHLGNTPKQIIVYEALGFKVPKFYHVPMILNPQGKKLSKRDGAMDVMEYKAMGYFPEALINFLVRLGWSYKDQEIFSMEEMLELFDPKDINKSASAYNAEKLLWLNSCYMKTLPHNRIESDLKDLGLDISNHPQKKLLVDAHRERAKTVAQLKEQMENIINEPKSYDAKAVKKFLKGEWREILEKFVGFMSQKELDSSEDFENATREFLEENELKLGKLAQPIRIAVTGGSVSPSVYDTMAIIGKDELLKRVDRLLKGMLVSKTEQE